MKNSKTTSKETTEGWQGTKTPNKRAQAIQRRLDFLWTLHTMTRESWLKVPMKALTTAYRITRSTTYLRTIGVIERKGVLYRWRGPSPSLEMAEAWCDYGMTYNRLRLHPNSAVKEEIRQTLEAVQTADKRADKIDAVLQWTYNYLHKGYRQISLSSVFPKKGIPHQAIQHLLIRGCLDRPRNGVYKWIGPPPDRELSLWLFGKLAEHHRTIYRSNMALKDRRTAMIDEMVGRVIPEPKETARSTELTAPPEERAPQGTGDYWRGSTTTW